MQEVRGGISELEPNIKGGRDAVASPGKEVHNQPRAVQLVKMRFLLNNVLLCVFFVSGLFFFVVV